MAQSQIAIGTSFSIIHDTEQGNMGQLLEFQKIKNVTNRYHDIMTQRRTKGFVVEMATEELNAEDCIPDAQQSELSHLRIEQAATKAKLVAWRARSKS